MSRTFLSCATETLYPLNDNSTFPSPPSPWQPLRCAFSVSTLFRSQLRCSLHNHQPSCFLAPFRSVSWATPLLVASLTLEHPSYGVPDHFPWTCLAFLSLLFILSSQHSFLGFTSSFHKTKFTGFFDSPCTGRWAVGGGKQGKKGMWTENEQARQLTPESFSLAQS